MNKFFDKMKGEKITEKGNCTKLLNLEMLNLNIVDCKLILKLKYWS